MSGYIIEDTEGDISYIDNNGEDVTYAKSLQLSTIEPYCGQEYSRLQEKRFKKVLYQLKETWYAIYSTIENFRSIGVINIEQSNEFMTKIHRMFVVEHRHRTEYYKEERMRLRKQKGYLKKKLDKIKNSKQKI